MTQTITCKLCRSTDTRLIQTIDRKPEVEVEYHIPVADYHRTVHHCRNCGVYFNVHDLIDFEEFYKGNYNYHINQSGLLGRFQRITNLPAGTSDNVERTSRVVDFLQSRYTDISLLNVLDVGSGTSVFLHELGKTVENTYCIDPDQAAVDHALAHAGVREGHCGNIFNYQPPVFFHLVTFNKVLEHVDQPVKNLQKATELLAENGCIYVELPEADRIVEAGKIAERAEFAVEHLTVYNEPSMEYLAESAGLEILDLQTITDPSGKYTIYAFLQKR